MPDKLLSEITPADIETARAHLEEVLIEFRDSRLPVQPGARYGHGLVVKEKDGELSPAIRLSTGEAIAMALKTILES